jgi:DNA-binding FrmR family transcriptional regulator
MAKAKAEKKTKRPSTDQMVKRFDGRNVKQPPAFVVLMKQHREVEDFFEAFERADSDETKAELAAKICLALKVHAQIEEELLYPPAHEQMSDEDMIDEAYVEHASCKDLIAQIESMEVGDHLYDAKVKVLSEYIAHHVEEEEKELFPEIEKDTEIDLVAMGPQLEARTKALKAELSKAPDGGRGVMPGKDKSVPAARI